jgi:SAM-dependent methyltransferase
MTWTPVRKKVVSPEFCSAVAELKPGMGRRYLVPVQAPARSPYPLDNSWEGEGDRLAAIEAAFDPGTRRYLEALGVGPGWRCLEVGAGAGSVVRWLSERVGERGSVLATDINPVLLGGLDLENVEVRVHDIERDELPRDTFDLIHSRLVLEHLPGREDTLRRMAAALAPGGWLVVEDLVWPAVGACSRKGAVLVGALLRGVSTTLRAAGYDPVFGRRLPVLLNGLGLVDVGAEGRALVIVGGDASQSVEWARPNLARFQRLVLGEEGSVSSPLQVAFDRLPALRRLAHRQLGRIDGYLRDPEFGFVAPVMMAAWGRRPA